MASLRSDIASCLDQNKPWKHQLFRALDDIENEYPNAEVDISIFNPATGILTLFFPTTREDGILYVPTYTLLVRDPEPVRMYYGGLQEEGAPLTFRQFLNKYYDGELFGLLMTMTWGGWESRDAEIIEDLGLAYRTFRCDVNAESRTFVRLHNDRWRPSDPVDIFKLFADYVEKNKKLVQQIVTKIALRSSGGTIDGSSAERLLDEQADINHGRQLGEFFVDAPGECDRCCGSFSEEKYMIDGKLRGAGAWGFMCADCFGFVGEGIGWGVGQLYLKEKDKWLLVGGFSPRSTEADE
jgi:hypothetical protein